MPKIGFVSLGCPKALVDSERILTRLKQDGYDLVAGYAEAEVVIVNTCGFIDSARQESLEAIGEAVQENGRVIVTGCLGVDAETIRARHPRVLSITGPQQYDRVVDAVHRHLPLIPGHDPFLDLVPPQGLKLTPPHYAYLKISEGCNHRCRFCIIPSLRGGLVSRELEDIAAEAETLVEAGVRELLVISQDTSAYGTDLKQQPGADLPGLCEILGSLGVWVRLHYVYPYPNVDKIIPLMAQGRILPYLDVPFQHGSPRILKRMRRPAAAQDTLTRIRAWREVCPELVIRSTFIVGFPGETEEDFDLLLDFLHLARLDRVGCFRYSPVAGAAANDLPDAVPEEIKEERWHRFMQAQAGISATRLKRRIGTDMEVLVDEVTEDGAVGRSYADAPEIDGNVYVAADGKLQPGDLIRVRIEAAGDYDLHGRQAA
ncbi:MAG: 30S ribosomal protein S12 methylthiotransferase RimO [Gammaproteobacteria bacterium]